MLYAIRLKEWMQIREAQKPPRPHTTTAPYVYESTEGGWINYRGDTVGGFPSSRQFTLTQVNWKGGRIVQHLKIPTFNAHSRVRVRANQAILLPPDDPIHDYLRSTA